MNRQEIKSWISKAADGDDAAATEIVNAYYDRLIGLARSKMLSLPQQVADEEGAVVSACTCRQQSPGKAFLRPQIQSELLLQIQLH